MQRLALVTLVVAGCGPETTSFRTTDTGDGTDRTGPPAAAYVDEVGGARANVHVWSNGGYIGTSDEPMTHVGFEIRNSGATSITFDGDALGLVVFDKHGVVRSAKFTALTPLGPSQVQIEPGVTLELDAYFTLPVRPRVVDRMRAGWSLRAGDMRSPHATSFVRDDDYPVIEPPAPRARELRD